MTQNANIIKFHTCFNVKLTEMWCEVSDEHSIYNSKRFSQLSCQVSHLPSVHSEDEHLSLRNPVRFAHVS